WSSSPTAPTTPPNGSSGCSPPIPAQVSCATPTPATPRRSSTPSGTASTSRAWKADDRGGSTEGDRERPRARDRGLVRRQRRRRRLVPERRLRRHVPVRGHRRRTRSAIRGVRDQHPRRLARSAELHVPRRGRAGGLPRPLRRVPAPGRGRGAAPAGVGLRPLPEVDGARGRRLGKRPVRDPDGRLTRGRAREVSGLGARPEARSRRRGRDRRPEAGVRTVPALAARAARRSGLALTLSRLLVRDLAQLVTPAGTGAPLRGRALGELDVTEDAYVLCQDGRVAGTGRMHDLPAALGDVDELDGRGLVAIPGLVDCHTHACFAGDRVEEFALRAAGATYEELHAGGGGILSTVRATRAAGEDALAAALDRHRRWMLKSGTTTFEAKSGYGLDRDTELAQLRTIAAAGGVPTWLGAHAVPPEFD